VRSPTLVKSLQVIFPHPGARTIPQCRAFRGAHRFTGPARL